MIVIHNNTNFSCTNLFQFDYDLKRVDGGKSFKKLLVIQNIKKLFNFDSNNYVTLNKGDKVTVIVPNKVYECEVAHVEKLIVIKALEIDIINTLKKLQNGRRITG